jgi:hypothetical protein
MSEIATPPVFSESCASIVLPSKSDQQTERLLYRLLLRCPEAFCASAMRASSISIVVRTGNPSICTDYFVH